MPEIKDLNKVISLEIECMGELRTEIGGEFPVFDERHNDEANLLAIIEGNCGCAFLAEDLVEYEKGKIAGAIVAIDEDMKTADETEHNKLFIASIFVDAAYRDQGIGSKLVELLQEWARVHNYKGIKTSVYTPNEKIENMLAGNSYRLVSEVREKSLI
jgi:GNAT superfamily N-acetyltransferase